MTRAGDLARRFEERAGELEVPEIAARIMGAAMELFARKGYAATSVREIVQEASVTNPMLYYYFESKEGVFKKLMELMVLHLNAKVFPILEEPEYTLEERVSAFVGVHLDAALESPHALRFFCAVLFGPPESRPEVDLIEMNRPLQDRLEAMFQGAIDRGELPGEGAGDALFYSVQLMGLIQQQMMLSMILSESAPGDVVYEHLSNLLGEQERERLVRFFFDGARGK